MKKKPVSVPLRRGQHAPKKSPAVTIDGVIHTIRGERVILDADLAALYGVKTKALNQAVRRNRDKFPHDFLLELTIAESVTLNRSQIVTGSQKHRDLRSKPFAFTEHGALMAATILNSPQAVQMSVFVIRAFAQIAAQRAPALESLHYVAGPCLAA